MCAPNLLASMQVARATWQGVQNVPLQDIVILPFLNFRASSSEEGENVALADSIRKYGIIQPIVVRPAKTLSKVDEGVARPKFELVCGHRRYAACEKLGAITVPCIMMPLDDREAFELALVENLQRQSLNPIEEAEALKSYVVSFGHGSLTRLARTVGKSEEYISHRLLLLGLPKALTERISRRLLTASHATELVWLKDAKMQIELSEEISKHDLSLRQVRSVTKLLKAGNVGVCEAVRTVLNRVPILLHNGGLDSKPEVGIEGIQPSLASWFLYQDTPGDGETKHNMKVLDHAILVARSSLAGLDLIVQRAEDQSNIRAFLMQERRVFHSVLDDIIRFKLSYEKKAAR